jgi:hypothetical protein
MAKMKPIPGFPGYQVTDDGRVWSDRTSRWLKPSPNSHGYQVVGLQADGRQYTRGVHVLVALAFIGPRPGRLVVCHGNGDRSDNRLVNLRYDTRSANMKDAVRHGTCKGGPGRGRKGPYLRD